ncbi:MAG: hypothetical protein AB7V46_02045 [Thermomicrobiales bacterium]
MRLEINDGDEVVRVIGAVVIRTSPVGDVSIDFGPADGLPLVRISMDVDQTRSLAVSLKGIVDGGGETVLIVDD